jgi:hypothetical protein
MTIHDFHSDSGPQDLYFFFFFFFFSGAQVLSYGATTVLSFKYDGSTWQSCIYLAAEQQLFGPHSNSLGLRELGLE